MTDTTRDTVTDSTSDTVIAARGVAKSYGSARSPGGIVHALHPLDVDIRAGVSLGIVGESGAGKSTLMNILLGLTAPDHGQVTFAGRPLRAGTARTENMRRFRRTVQVVFQDPRGSLDPRMRVRRIIGEPLRSLHVAGDHDSRIEEVLAEVGLGPDAMDRYPREFSGGERQRIAIARALAPRPKVLFGDEPVSALDLSTRAQILRLLLELRERHGLSLVLVSHDLAVIGQSCAEVMILKDGALVEHGPVPTVFATPRTGYARQLLDAVPSLT